MFDDLEAQPPPAESAGEPGKPWYRRWWAITLGGLLTLFVVAGIFGDDTDTTTTDEPTAAATSAPSEPEPTEDVAAPEPEPEPEVPVEATITAAPAPPTTTPAPPPPPAPLAAVPPPAEPADGCHPSYEPCVPIASDVDCEGGSGDGPVYTGRVRVIGPDEYDLDRDGDGVGCD
jgi:hypothetical protein